MFLPVLLLRDYGLLGFVVFGVPNVIGAAAMGWILPTPESARRILQQHAGACRLFSAITIGYHAFFISWLLRIWWHNANTPSSIWIVFVLGMVVIAVVWFVRSKSSGRGLATVLWLFSAAVLAVTLMTPSPPAATQTGLQPVTDLIWFTPVSFFGFALCPYLDLTFLHVRASCDNARSRTAFGLGFGILFLIMILLTLAYTPVLLPMIQNQRTPVPMLMGVLLLSHIGAQLAFSVGVHNRRFKVEKNHERSAVDPFFVPIITIAGIIGLAAPFMPTIHSMSGHEILYRSFLSFYGLAFPAYVWLVMIPPSRRGYSSSPTQRAGALRVWLIAIILAGPFYWAGFIAGQEIWFVPGVLIILLARTFLHRPASSV